MNFWDVMSMLGSLALIVVVLVATYFATRWYARRMGQSGAGKYIKVLEKTVLGTGSALSIVQIGDKYYLLGISDKNIQLISALPDFEPSPDSPPAASPFAKVLQDLMEKSKTSFGKKDHGGEDE